MLSELFAPQALASLVKTPRKRKVFTVSDTPTKQKKTRTGLDESEVQEPDAAHWERHSAQPSSQTCSRCNFIRNKAHLQREHPWLTPRPIFMGGPWRLGCDLCAWMFAHAERENHRGRQGCKTRACAFAKYQFGSCQAPYKTIRDGINAHQNVSGHRAAVIASQRCSQQLPQQMSAKPDGITYRPLAMMVPTMIAEATSEVVDSEDSRLLKGRVPQCQDWLNAWSESTEQIAFHKQARILLKKNAMKWANVRRIRGKQVGIIAEARREVIRKQLGEAQFISLSMDDRQYQKVVRFRCDAPAKPFVHNGILGVMGLEKSAVRDFEEDHAVIGVRKLDAFLNKFCTPLGPKGRPLATNNALKDHIRKCTRTFAADGASKERRALLLATHELFPNVVLLLRDAAHALRIAIRDPLHYDALFGEVWTVLFSERHALVPDVMNSQKWQDLLQNIQREVLRIPAESQPLAVVLKHLRFAKQRFDSSADPIAKVAFMLLPLATLLAFIGSDERHKPCDRERAKYMLKKLDSKFALAIGVSADWGLVTQAFLRLFDKQAHDIAKTHSQIHGFKQAMRILFAEGGVFSSRDTTQSVRPSKVPAISGYFGAAGVKPMFVTQHLEQMLRKRIVFNCGNEQVLLWGLPEKDDVREVAERLKFVTTHVIDRVDAEFGHLSLYSCFDVPELRAAFGCKDPDEAKQLQQSLQRNIRQIAEDLRVDGRTAAREYRMVAFLILDFTSPGRPLATASNCEVWQEMLMPTVCLSQLPQSSAMQALHFLIRFYISIEDGECAVERDLGLLAKFNTAHNNGSNDLADDLMLARSDPITVSDICGGDLADGGCSTRLGPKARRWATLWRSIHGARIGCGRTGSLRGKRKGTFAAAKAGVLAAAEYAVASALQHTGEHGQEADALTPLGVRKSSLGSAIGDNAVLYNNARTRRFNALTKKKKTSSQPAVSRMAFVRKHKAVKAAKTVQKLEAIREVCYLGEVGATLPHPDAEGQTHLIEETTGWKRSLQADLVVVDDLSRLCDCPDDATVNHVLAIMARGLPAITRASWVMARGDPGCVPRASVIRHRPLAMSMKVVFQYDSHFQARSGTVVKTIQALCAPKLPRSKWKFRSASAVGESSSAAADRGYEIVQLTGVDVVRSWVQKTRRIHNVMGSKAWSLDQPMF